MSIHREGQHVAKAPEPCWLPATPLLHLGRLRWRSELRGLRRHACNIENHEKYVKSAQLSLSGRVSHHGSTLASRNAPLCLGRLRGHSAVRDWLTLRACLLPDHGRVKR